MLLSNLRTGTAVFFSRRLLGLPPRRVLLLLSVAITLALLLYSQTMSFVWDEGFHLLSAQLIGNGKIPYLDYCFPQTPLNAYWNAAWMRLVDQDWRVTHVVAALETAGSIYLMADWILLRFPVLVWQLPCAIAAAMLISCNTMVVQFGTIAQAYAIGMLLAVTAFRLTIRSATRPSPAPAFFAGLSASAAAGCTLLTAPILPVLLPWLWCYSIAGDRRRKAAAFVLGCIPPFIPVFILFARAPAQTLFNVVRYQAIFRRVNWPGATTHDLDVFSAWLQSAPALMMLFFGVAGFLYLRTRSGWDRQLKAEFRLCAYLSLALILYISTAHPTFQRYMIVAVPFCAGISVVGFYSLGSRLARAANPRWPLLVVCGLMILSIAKDLFDDRDATRWSEYEKIARKIREVTPAGAPLYADEEVYFLLRWTPPPGMEFSYSHKLSLPKDQEALYHIISEPELTAQVKDGKYATVESCKDDRIDEMKLPDLFPHQQDIGDCTVFWGKLKTQAAAKPGD